jgi:hypothetical protein
MGPAKWRLQDVGEPKYTLCTPKPSLTCNYATAGKGTTAIELRVPSYTHLGPATDIWGSGRHILLGWSWMRFS